MNPSIEEFYKSYNIDDDFDEKFYTLEYPIVADFYLPYCLNNNIDDKHRLFYHWFYYGQNHYKNHKQKQEDLFIGKKHIRLSNNNNDTSLAIITALFNPCHYISHQYNYLEFKKHIEQFGDLFTAEISFNGKFLSPTKNSVHIKGSNNNILWQKERLLNIALESLPKIYKNIAWIDCDIIFDDPLWHKQLLCLLQDYKIVHLFKNATRENIFSESILNNISQGVSGFAWAARREELDAVKFLDNQVIGGADLIMASSFMSRLDILHRRQMNYIDNAQTQDWIKDTTASIGGSVSNINCTIQHLYHGSIDNRQYQDRTELITEINNSKIFLSSVDKYIWHNANNNLTQKIIAYLKNRQEDDQIITINNYFDHVYLLNLDKDQNKLLTITQKLNQLSIDFTRFKAIDGTNLQYDNKEFKIGYGHIENKYALACLYSHIEIIKEAKSKDYQRILILEDDVQFIENINLYLQYLRKISEWKLLYLGGSQHNWNNIEYLSNFYYSNQTLGTFAYGVDHSVYDDIINYNHTKSIDNHLSDIQKKYYKQCYTFYPNICIADVTSSNIREPRDQNLHNKLMKWDLYRYD